MRFVGKRRFCCDSAFFIEAKKARLFADLGFYRKRPVDTTSDGLASLDIRPTPSKVFITGVETVYFDSDKLNHKIRFVSDEPTKLNLKYFSNFLPPLNKQKASFNNQDEVMSRYNHQQENVVSSEDKWLDNQFWTKDYAAYEDTVHGMEINDIDSFNCFQHWKQHVMEFNPSSIEQHGNGTSCDL